LKCRQLLILFVALFWIAAPARASMPATSVQFEGLGDVSQFLQNPGAWGIADPPRPSGAVGLTQYVETVNNGLAVFDKHGGLLKGPVYLSTLWSGYGTSDGNRCSTENDGDAMVRYDQIADRWLIVQQDVHNANAAVSGPSYECVAVSKTADATGAYWLYDFEYSSNLNNSVRIGVWSDGYYVTYDLFNYTVTNDTPSFTFEGTDVCAWDRAAMLAGQNLAPQANGPSSQKCFQQSSSVYGLAPADLDGMAEPPSGSPDYIFSLGTNALEAWKFHVDWTSPGDSSLTRLPDIPVDSFNQACSSSQSRTCIPQESTSTPLDSVSDLVMDRVAYRNFGDHESIVLNHSITTTPSVGGTSVGVRWYELRVADQTPSVYQQGTQAPDSVYRWMGSIAQDHGGDIAMGFSASSASSYPGIAVAGRLPGDPLNAMGQGEELLKQSFTYQGNDNPPTPGLTPRGRWGDISSMTVDPSDDCTFWYLNEWMPLSSTSPAHDQSWDTEISAFKFPGCQVTASIAASPSSLSVAQGTSGTSTISTTAGQLAGQSVTLSVSGLPAGATASFQPVIITEPAAAAGGQDSTLTLSAGPDTPPGTYTVTVTGASASTTLTTQITFTVTLTTHSLSVVKSVAGSGSVTSSPAGISCGTACSFQFDMGTNVTLTATPDPGSVFLGWSGACSGVSTCPLSIDGDKSVIANFDRSPTCSDLSGLTAPAGKALPLTLSCSDQDSGDTITYEVLSQPSHGRLGPVDQAGHISYTPDTGYSGSDSFTFKATDNHGVDSNIGTLTLSVPAPNPVTAPKATFSPLALDLGEEAVGLVSQPQSETLTNQGSGPLTVTSVTVGGANAGDFTRSSDGCSGRTVDPGGSCAVTVTFRPASPGGRFASLQFSDNADGSPQTVELSGSGIARTPGQSYALQSVAANQNNTTTIVLIPTAPGTVTLTLTIPTASVSHARRCKRGQFWINKRCRPAITTIGTAHAPANTGVPLVLKISLSPQIRAKLRAGRTLHAILTITFKPVGGGLAKALAKRITLRGVKT
jgi:hypothetical protein